MGITGSQNLKNIFALSEEKLNILKEILDISLKIKDEADNASRAWAEGESRVEFESRTEFETDGAIEKISALADFRGELVEKIKNIDLSVKHYGSLLRGQDIKTLEEFETQSEPAINAKIVLDGIKSADDANSRLISDLMAEMKDKIKFVRENRALMDKFVGDGEISTAGTLLSEKK